MFRAINYVLEQGGAIIKALSSTKNKEKARNPEMHQTKKGNKWRFGMKCHIGVYTRTGYVHTVTATSADAKDIFQKLIICCVKKTRLYTEIRVISELKSEKKSKMMKIYVR